MGRRDLALMGSFSIVFVQKHEKYLTGLSLLPCSRC